MEPQSIWYAIALVLVLAGLAGTVLPALPGLPLVFAGMVLAAWAGGFAEVGAAALVALGVLTLLSVLVDFWATAMGAKRVGASRTALVGAVVGTFAGLFFGIVGVFVGPFLGAMAGELLHRRRVDPRGFGHATRVGAGTWIGIVVAVALKLMLACAMIGIFALAWFT
ncbi:DUF456 domain-containing protein [Luteimonas sp. RD2P54]|uniref:DUF456 domain-containing protein n=1 Tax=Luteimonas endophytica TaxID=3042023 RepID=A0ABT6JDV4_9GAMM|nr:DUF456 domain-containing protein [Luteimonas endophytica]MDH5824383.1 DUF456 domain-containing protein [Luteimonas endophytica]